MLALTNNPQGGMISKFLRWWGAELMALAPRGLGAALGLSQEIALITQDGGDFIVVADRRSFGGAPATGALSSPDMASMLSARRAAGAECVLRLQAEQGLRREAHIAHAALARGFDAFRGEIERQTPFAPDQVYLGYTTDTALDPRGRVLAKFVVAPCAAVDETLDRLRSFGVTPDRITLADAADPAYPGDTVRRLALLRRHAPKRLLIAALLLLIAALVSPFIQNAVMRQTIQSELVLLRKDPALLAQQHSRPDAQAQFSYLAAQRGGRLPSVAILDALSKALPDTAHLAQFNLSGSELSLQGVARSASNLIAPIEALEMVAEVGFAAPVLRDPAAGYEQFQLTLKLRDPGAAP